MSVANSDSEKDVVVAYGVNKLSKGLDWPSVSTNSRVPNLY